jgi:lipoprotein-anchoring transpeptidase ErfK/SrfK
MIKRALPLLLVPLLLAACGGQAASRWVEPSTSPTPAGPPPTLEITPADGDTDALLSTEIGTETDGEITEVRLASADGDPIGGSMRDDGTSWVPDQPLAPDTRYTAQVTSTGADGQTTTAETSFTTMAAPSSRTDTGLYLFDDQEYGVAMPVVVEFVQPVPEDARADVQRRMFVSTDPPQPGVWSWYPSGTVAFYRAEEYWQPGTTLDVRIALDGVPTGNGRYGDTDRSATATIGDHLEMRVDNETKTMKVYENGDVIRTMPVSLGKPSTPSSSGHMVIMSRERETVFDTFAELGPEEGYRIDIEYAMRLTWSGQFIHAAPWSEGDQGERNVSHGCVNLSTSNAEWLFGVAKVGDPVIVSGTEDQLEYGNGWTAWDLSWEEFIEGSALPVPDELR